MLLWTNVVSYEVQNIIILKRWTRRRKTNLEQLAPNGSVAKLVSIFFCFAQPRVLLVTTPWVAEPWNLFEGGGQKCTSKNYRNLLRFELATVTSQAFKSGLKLGATPSGKTKWRVLSPRAPPVPPPVDNSYIYFRNFTQISHTGL